MRKTYLVLLAVLFMFLMACGGGGGDAAVAPPALTAVDLPKTGQITSYDTGAIDDGDLQRGVAWPSPRFTTGTGAGVDCVTDNLTGLMWAENGNLPAGQL